MGTVLEDLRDYLEVDGGVQLSAGVDRPAGADATGLQRYANVVSARKEAELNDFKENLRSGMPTLEDHPPQRLRYTRLETPDLEDYDHPGTPSAGSDSASLREDSMALDKPLTPAAPSASNTKLDDRDEDSYLLPFLPPFPVTIQQDTEDDLKEQEREEQLRREEELQKQKEAERTEKESTEDGAIVQSIPANYIVPAPYEMSKLQARGTWHLPSISHSVISDVEEKGTSGPSSVPFVRGSSTTEELLSALHALSPSTSTDSVPPTPSASSFHSISTNPSRHKVSLVFLGTTPARFNTPDTLFGLGASLSVTPRPSNPLPTYVHALEEQPGARDPKAAKGKPVGDLPLPPSQGRSVGVPATIINAVSGSSSRIPVVGRALLSKPTFTRTKRLGPPPAQKRDEKLLLYHPPNPPLPAHWNTAVSGSNATANIGHDHTKGRQERNPFGVAEATLGYTWDWNVKLPREGLEKVKSLTTAPPPSATHGPGESQLTNPVQPNGSNGHPTKERLLPKLSVSVPGRKQSMLSTSTPVSGNPLVARIPTLGERTHSNSGLTSSMLPPPLPGSAVSGNGEPPRKPILSIRLTHNRSSSQPSVKVSGDIRTASPDLNPVSNIKTEGIEEKVVLHESPMDTDVDTMLASTVPFDEKPPLSTVQRLDSVGDMDIDAALAEVIGEDTNEMTKVNGDQDEDADLEDVFGMSPTTVPPSTANHVHKGLLPASDEDVDLDDLLLSGDPKGPTTEEHDHSFDLSITAVGDPPLPPGDGSSYIFSEMDRIPATTAGTMSFSSSTTLPLATSALRTTTTPLIPTPQQHQSNGVVSQQVPETLERSYFAEHLEHKDDPSTTLVSVQKESSSTPLVPPQGHY